MENYSFDMLKVAAFEKELETLECHGCNDCDIDTIKHYLEDRIIEIKELYK